MEWSRSVRHDSPFSILTVDIDHFKNFNDQYGHQTGDVALCRVSKAAQAALRSDDIWCRYGGEEFIALLPRTTLEQAMVVAERLRLSVAGTTIASSRGSLGVSVSIGVAERSAEHSSLSEVLAASDAALYKAKAAGRNTVVGDEPDAGSA
ncbi:MAG: GGDEF domain-containing protein [Propionivibrio sp.]